MKKKVFILILALFVLMPVSGVFASNQTLNYTNVNSSRFTDRPSSNRFAFPGGYYYEVRFDEPVYISEMNFYVGFYSYTERLRIVINNDYENPLFYPKPAENFRLTIDKSNITDLRIYNDGPNIHHVVNDPVFRGYVMGANIYEVTLGNFNAEHNSINISFDKPDNVKYVNVYIDDVIVLNNYDKTNYIFEGLNHNQLYKVKITTVDENGVESKGVTKEISTANINSGLLSDITQINAEVSHDRVDLSWGLPETEYFEHVNIYRKSVSDVQTFNLLSTDGYDPLFETNGTYFNDLTVKEQTTYDYKLTTEFQGLESQGVTVQATTLAAPPPELGGQEFEELENGDYLVTWQQPETGQVRIFVDGKEYVVVPATDKQYTIPAADMKYSALGDPLIGLQTIGDNGEESEVVQQESNVNLPFGINELLTTSAGLMRLVSGLILLGLSFILVPKFVKMIKQSLNNKKNAETERTEREQRVSERAYREPRESRISTREGRTSTRVPRNYRKGE